MTNLRLLYVVGGLDAPSLTFVRDLVTSFSEKSVDFHLATSTRPITPLSPRINLHCGDIFRRPYLDRIALKISQRSLLLNVYDRFATSRHSKNNFSTLLKKISPHAVFIEFGHNAVLLEPILSLKGIPYFTHFHGLDITALTQNPYYRRGLQKVFTTCSGIVAASDHIRRLLHLAGADERKTRVIRLQPADHYHANKHLIESRFEGPPKIGFLGRLTEKKHPIALVEAFRHVKARFPEAVLTIIGDGPMRANIESRVRRYSMEKAVRMLPFLPHGDALKEICANWAYAQHSVTSSEGDQEGFAISVSEAALLKLPVISTLHNGIPEHVIHNQTGLLSQEYNYDEMGKNMVALMSSPERCKKMGDAGRQIALSFTSNRDRAEEILAFIQESRLLRCRQLGSHDQNIA